MKKFVIFSLSLGLSLCVAGFLTWENPKKPSKQKFEKLLAEFLTKQELCLTLTLPGESEVQVEDERLKNPYSNTVEVYDALTKAKLLNKKRIIIPSPYEFMGASVKRIWTLNDEGRKYIKGSKLCYGRKKLKELLSFSVPGSEEAGGPVLSMVYYKYEVVEIPKWAGTEEFRSIEPSLIMTHKIDKAFHEKHEIEAHHQVMLMNNGWKVLKGAFD